MSLCLQIPISGGPFDGATIPDPNLLAFDLEPDNSYRVRQAAGPDLVDFGIFRPFEMLNPGLYDNPPDDWLVASVSIANAGALSITVQVQTIEGGLDVTQSVNLTSTVVPSTGGILLSTGTQLRILSDGGAAAEVVFSLCPLSKEDCPQVVCDCALGFVLPT